MDLPRPRARLIGILGAAWGLIGGGHLSSRSARAAGPPEARGVRLALPATGLPFSPTDLELAVQARLTLVRDDGPATAVVISPSPATGTVVVTSAQRLEEVTVAGKSATEAARLVALAVVAVVRPAAIDSAASYGGEITAVADRSHDDPTPGRQRWSVGAATGVSLGLHDGGATFEPLIDGAWSWGAPAGAAPGGARPWQIALGLGFSRAQVAWSDGDKGGDFVLDTFPVRLGLRRRWQFVTVGAGPVVRMFRTSGLDGGGGAVAGGYASVGTELALGGQLRATVTLSGDLDSQRLVFRAAGTPLLTAGPFIPWLGVGLRWGAS